MLPPKPSRPPAHCYKQPPAQSSPSSSSPKPRLPADLRDRILFAFFKNMHDQGGANIDRALNQLPPLSLVCRDWAKKVRAEYLKWTPFDLRMRMRQIGGDVELFDPELIEGRIEDFRRARCSCCHTRGGLRITLDNPDDKELKARAKLWRRTMDNIISQFKPCPQLQIDFGDSKSGCYVDLVWRFIHLEKLLLCSIQTRERAEIRLNVPSFHPNSTSTLTRLDLFGIDLVTWNVSFPAMKTLTLNQVQFVSSKNDGIDSFSTETLSRQFFDSFPNLKALALEGLKDVSPCAFSRLKMFSVTRLYIGSCTPRTTNSCSDCMESDLLLPTLSRYFHCRIKHLILSPNEDSRPLLDSILLSRNDKLHPGYLKRLESVQVALPFSCDQVEEAEHQAWLEDYRDETRWLVEEALEDSGLGEVEIKFWERTGPMTLSEWEPWC